MSLEISSPVRHAALTLHAMAPHDAAWLLQQLPAMEAAELQSLLEELRGLGIPSDTRLLDALRQDDDTPRPPFAGKAGTRGLTLEALKRELDGARAELLLPILKPEPLPLLALLLSLNSWAWTDSLLASLETHRRLSLRQQLDSPGLNAEAANVQAAQQLQLALLRRLLMRYQTAEAGVAMRKETDAQPGGFEQWWQERRRFWSSIVAPMKARK
jgi:hypothetical protein